MNKLAGISHEYSIQVHNAGNHFSPGYFTQQPTFQARIEASPKMQMATSIEKENGEMIVKRVSVPIGLEEMMEGLTKEVIMKKPSDIYLFASKYFTRLLELRQQGDYIRMPIKSAQSAAKQSRSGNIEKIIGKKTIDFTRAKPPKQAIVRPDTSRSSLPDRKNTSKHTGDRTKIDGKQILDKHKARKVLGDKEGKGDSRRSETGSKEKLSPRVSSERKQSTRERSSSRSYKDKHDKSPREINRIAEDLEITQSPRKRKSQSTRTGADESSPRGNKATDKTRDRDNNSEKSREKGAQPVTKSDKHRRSKGKDSESEIERKTITDVSTSEADDITMKSSSRKQRAASSRDSSQTEHSTGSPRKLSLRSSDLSLAASGLSTKRSKKSNHDKKVKILKVVGGALEVVSATDTASSDHRDDVSENDTSISEAQVDFSERTESAVSETSSLSVRDRSQISNESSEKRKKSDNGENILLEVEVSDGNVKITYDAAKLHSEIEEVHGSNRELPSQGSQSTDEQVGTIPSEEISNDEMRAFISKEDTLESESSERDIGKYETGQSSETIDKITEEGSSALASATESDKRIVRKCTGVAKNTGFSSNESVYSDQNAGELGSSELGGKDSPSDASSTLGAEELPSSQNTVKINSVKVADGVLENLDTGVIEPPNPEDIGRGETFSNDISNDQETPYDMKALQDETKGSLSNVPEADGRILTESREKAVEPLIPSNKEGEVKTVCALKTAKEMNDLYLSGEHSDSSKQASASKITVGIEPNREKDPTTVVSEAAIQAVDDIIGRAINADIVASEDSNTSQQSSSVGADNGVQEDQKIPSEETHGGESAKIKSVINEPIVSDEVTHHPSKRSIVEDENVMEKNDQKRGDDANLNKGENETVTNEMEGEDAIKKTYHDNAKRVDMISDQVEDATRKTHDDTIEGAGTMIGKGGDSIKNTDDDLFKGVTIINDHSKDVIKKTKDEISEEVAIIGNVEDVVEKAHDSTAEEVGTIAQKLGDAAEDTHDTVKEADITSERVKHAVEKTQKDPSEGIGTIGQQVRDATKKIHDDSVDEVATLTDKVEDTVNATHDHVSEGIGLISDHLVDAAEKTHDTTAKGVDTMSVKAEDAAKEIHDNIDEAVGIMSDQAQHVAKKTDDYTKKVTDTVEGIGSTSEKVKDAVKEIYEDAVKKPQNASSLVENDDTAERGVIIHDQITDAVVDGRIGNITDQVVKKIRDNTDEGADIFSETVEDAIQKTQDKTIEEADKMSEVVEDEVKKSYDDTVKEVNTIGETSQDVVEKAHDDTIEGVSKLSDRIEDVVTHDDTAERGSTISEQVKDAVVDGLVESNINDQVEDTVKKTHDHTDAASDTMNDKVEDSVKETHDNIIDEGVVANAVDDTHDYTVHKAHIEKVEAAEKTTDKTLEKVDKFSGKVVDSLKMRNDNTIVEAHIMNQKVEDAVKKTHDNNDEGVDAHTDKKMHDNTIEGSDEMNEKVGDAAKKIHDDTVKEVSTIGGKAQDVVEKAHDDTVEGVNENSYRVEYDDTGERGSIISDQIKDAVVDGVVGRVYNVNDQVQGAVKKTHDNTDEIIDTMNEKVEHAVNKPADNIGEGVGDDAVKETHDNTIAEGDKVSEKVEDAVKKTHDETAKEVSAVGDKAQDAVETAQNDVEKVGRISDEIENAAAHDDTPEKGGIMSDQIKDAVVDDLVERTGYISEQAEDAVKKTHDNIGKGVAADAVKKTQDNTIEGADEISEKVEDAVKKIHVNIDEGVGADASEKTHDNTIEIADEMNEKVEGEVKNIHDNIGKDVAADAVKKTHDNTIEGADEMSEKVEDAVKKIHDNIDEGVGADESEKTHDNTTEGAEEMSEKVEDAVKKTHDNTGKGVAADAVKKTHDNTIEGADEMSEKVEDAVKKIHDNIDEGVGDDASEKIHDNTIEGADEMSEKVEDAVKKIHDNIEKGVGADASEKTHDNTVEGADEMSEKIEDAVKQTHDNIDEGVGADANEKTHDNTIEGADEMSEKVEDAVKQTHDNIDEGVGADANEKTHDNTIEGADEMSEKVEDAVKQTHDNIDEGVGADANEKTHDNTIEGADEMGEKVEDAVKKIHDNIEEGVNASEKTHDNTVEGADKMSETVEDAVKKTHDETVKEVSAIGDKAQDAVEKADDDVEEVGKIGDEIENVATQEDTAERGGAMSDQMKDAVVDGIVERIGNIEQAKDAAKQTHDNNDESVGADATEETHDNTLERADEIGEKVDDVFKKTHDDIVNKVSTTGGKVQDVVDKAHEDTIEGVDQIGHSVDDVATHDDTEERGGAISDQIKDAVADGLVGIHDDTDEGIDTMIKKENAVKEPHDNIGEGVGEDAVRKSHDNSIVGADEMSEKVEDAAKTHETVKEVSAIGDKAQDAVEKAHDDVEEVGKIGDEIENAAAHDDTAERGGTISNQIKDAVKDDLVERSGNISEQAGDAVKKAHDNIGKGVAADAETHDNTIEGAYEMSEKVEDADQKTHVSIGEGDGADTIKKTHNNAIEGADEITEKAEDAVKKTYNDTVNTDSTIGGTAQDVLAKAHGDTVEEVGETSDEIKDEATHDNTAERGDTINDQIQDVVVGGLVEKVGNISEHVEDAVKKIHHNSNKGADAMSGKIEHAVKKTHDDAGDNGNSQVQIHRGSSLETMPASRIDDNKITEASPVGGNFADTSSDFLSVERLQYDNPKNDVHDRKEDKVGIKISHDAFKPHDSHVEPIGTNTEKVGSVIEKVHEGRVVDKISKNLQDTTAEKTHDAIKETGKFSTELGASVPKTHDAFVGGLTQTDDKASEATDKADYVADKRENVAVAEKLRVRNRRSTDNEIDKASDEIRDSINETQGEINLHDSSCVEKISGLNSNVDKPAQAELFAPNFRDHSSSFFNVERSRYDNPPNEGSAVVSYIGEGDEGNDNGNLAAIPKKLMTLDSSLNASENSPKAFNLQLGKGIPGPSYQSAKSPINDVTSEKLNKQEPIENAGRPHFSETGLGKLTKGKNGDSEHEAEIKKSPKRKNREMPDTTNHDNIPSQPFGNENQECHRENNESLVLSKESEEHLKNETGEPLHAMPYENSPSVHFKMNSENTNQLTKTESGEVVVENIDKVEKDEALYMDPPDFDTADLKKETDKHGKSKLIQASTEKSIKEISVNRRGIGKDESQANKNFGHDKVREKHDSNFDIEKLRQEIHDVTGHPEDKSAVELPTQTTYAEAPLGERTDIADTMSEQHRSNFDIEKLKQEIHDTTHYTDSKPALELPTKTTYEEGPLDEGTDIAHTTVSEDNESAFDMEKLRREIHDATDHVDSNSAVNLPSQTTQSEADLGKGANIADSTKSKKRGSDFDMEKLRQEIDSAIDHPDNKSAHELPTQTTQSESQSGEQEGNYIAHTTVSEKHESNFDTEKLKREIHDATDHTDVKPASELPTQTTYAEAPLWKRTDIADTTMSEQHRSHFDIEKLKQEIHDTTHYTDSKPAVDLPTKTTYEEAPLGERIDIADSTLSEKHENNFDMKKLRQETHDVTDHPDNKSAVDLPTQTTHTESQSGAATDIAHVTVSEKQGSNFDMEKLKTEIHDATDHVDSNSAVKLPSQTTQSEHQLKEGADIADSTISEKPESNFDTEKLKREIHDATDDTDVKPAIELPTQTTYVEAPLGEETDNAGRTISGKHENELDMEKLRQETHDVTDHPDNKSAVDLPTQTTHTESPLGKGADIARVRVSEKHGSNFDTQKLKREIHDATAHTYVKPAIELSTETTHAEASLEERTDIADSTMSEKHERGFDMEKLRQETHDVTDHLDDKSAVDLPTQTTHTESALGNGTDIARVTVSEKHGSNFDTEKLKREIHDATDHTYVKPTIELPKQTTYEEAPLVERTDIAHSTMNEKHESDFDIKKLRQEAHDVTDHTDNKSAVDLPTQTTHTESPLGAGTDIAHVIVSEKQGSNFDMEKLKREIHDATDHVDSNSAVQLPSHTTQSEAQFGVGADIADSTISEKPESNLDTEKLKREIHDLTDHTDVKPAIELPTQTTYVEAPLGEETEIAGRTISEKHENELDMEKLRQETHEVTDHPDNKSAVDLPTQITHTERPLGNGTDNEHVIAVSHRNGSKFDIHKLKRELHDATDHTDGKPAVDMPIQTTYAEVPLGEKADIAHTTVSEEHGSNFDIEKLKGEIQDASDYTDRREVTFPTQTIHTETSSGRGADVAHAHVSEEHQRNFDIEKLKGEIYDTTDYTDNESAVDLTQATHAEVALDPSGPPLLEPKQESIHGRESVVNSTGNNKLIENNKTNPNESDQIQYTELSNGTHDFIATERNTNLDSGLVKSIRISLHGDDDETCSDIDSYTHGDEEQRTLSSDSLKHKEAMLSLENDPNPVNCENKCAVNDQQSIDEELPDHVKSQLIIDNNSNSRVASSSHEKTLSDMKNDGLEHVDVSSALGHGSRTDDVSSGIDDRKLSTNEDDDRDQLDQILKPTSELIRRESHTNIDSGMTESVRISLHGDDENADNLENADITGDEKTSYNSQISNGEKDVLSEPKTTTSDNEDSTHQTNNSEKSITDDRKTAEIHSTPNMDNEGVKSNETQISTAIVSTRKPTDERKKMTLNEKGKSVSAPVFDVRMLHEEIHSVHSGENIMSNSKNKVATNDNDEVNLSEHKIFDPSKLRGEILSSNNNKQWKHQLFDKDSADAKMTSEEEDKEQCTSESKQITEDSAKPGMHVQKVQETTKKTYMKDPQISSAQKYGWTYPKNDIPMVKRPKDAIDEKFVTCQSSTKKTHIRLDSRFLEGTETLTSEAKSAQTDEDVTDDDSLRSPDSLEGDGDSRIDDILERKQEAKHLPEIAIHSQNRERRDLIAITPQLNNQYALSKNEKMKNDITTDYDNEHPNTIPDTHVDVNGSNQLQESQNSTKTEYEDSLGKVDEKVETSDEPGETTSLVTKVAKMIDETPCVITSSLDGDNSVRCASITDATNSREPKANEEAVRKSAEDINLTSKATEKFIHLEKDHSTNLLPTDLHFKPNLFSEKENAKQNNKKAVIKKPVSRRAQPVKDEESLIKVKGLKLEATRRAGMKAKKSTSLDETQKKDKPKSIKSRSQSHDLQSRIPVKEDIKFTKVRKRSSSQDVLLKTQPQPRTSDDKQTATGLRRIKSVDAGLQQKDKITTKHSFQRKTPNGLKKQRSETPADVTGKTGIVNTIVSSSITHNSEHKNQEQLAPSKTEVENEAGFETNVAEMNASAENLEDEGKHSEDVVGRKGTDEMDVKLGEDEEGRVKSETAPGSVEVTNETRKQKDKDEGQNVSHLYHLNVDDEKATAKTAIVLSEAKAALKIQEFWRQFAIKRKKITKDESNQSSHISQRYHLLNNIDENQNIIETKLIRTGVEPPEKTVTTNSPSLFTPTEEGGGDEEGKELNLVDEKVTEGAHLKEKHSTIKHDESSSRSNANFHKAAMKIQSCWRGFHVRKHKTGSDLFGNKVGDDGSRIEVLKDANKPDKKSSSAVTIQRVWRGYNVRKNIKDVEKKFTDLQESNEVASNQAGPSDHDIYRAASKIQAAVRSHIARKNLPRHQELLNISEESSTRSNSQVDTPIQEERDTNISEEKPVHDDEKLMETLNQLDHVSVPTHSPDNHDEKPCLERKVTVDEPVCTKKTLGLLADNSEETADENIADITCPKNEKCQRTSTEHNTNGRNNEEDTMGSKVTPNGTGNQPHNEEHRSEKDVETETRQQDGSKVNIVKSSDDNSQSCYTSKTACPESPESYNNIQVSEMSTSQGAEHVEEVEPKIDNIHKISVHGERFTVEKSHDEEQNTEDKNKQRNHGIESTTMNGSEHLPDGSKLNFMLTNNQNKTDAAINNINSNIADINVLDTTLANDENNVIEKHVPENLDQSTALERDSNATEDLIQQAVGVDSELGGNKPEITSKSNETIKVVASTNEIKDQNKPNEREMGSTEVNKDVNEKASHLPAAMSDSKIETSEDILQSSDVIENTQNNLHVTIPTNKYIQLKNATKDDNSNRISSEWEQHNDLSKDGEKVALNTDRSSTDKGINNSDLTASEVSYFASTQPDHKRGDEKVIYSGDKSKHSDEYSEERQFDYDENIPDSKHLLMRSATPVDKTYGGLAESSVVNKIESAVSINEKLDKPLISVEQTHEHENIQQEDTEDSDSGIKSGTTSASLDELTPEPISRGPSLSSNSSTDSTSTVVFVPTTEKGADRIVSAPLTEKDLQEMPINEKDKFDISKLHQEIENTSLTEDSNDLKTSDQRATTDDLQKDCMEENTVRTEDKTHAQHAHMTPNEFNAAKSSQVDEKYPDNFPTVSLEGRPTVENDISSETEYDKSSSPVKSEMISDDTAATTIQSAFRGYRVRRRLKNVDAGDLKNFPVNRELTDIKEEDGEETSASSVDLSKRSSQSKVLGDANKHFIKIDVEVSDMKHDAKDTPLDSSHSKTVHKKEHHQTQIPVHLIGDSVTVPIVISRAPSPSSEPGSIVAEVQTTQTHRESQTTDENAAPVQVDLEDVPAGAEVLTSRRDFPIDTDAREAHASDKDVPTCELKPDNTERRDTSMEAEKRNNASLTNAKNMEVEAATKIQAGFRGYQVRKQMKQKTNASGEISNQRRSARRKSSGRITDTSRTSAKPAPEIEEKSAVKIQAGIRGFLVRRRQKKQQKQENHSS